MNVASPIRSQAGWSAGGRAGLRACSPAGRRLSTAGRLVGEWAGQPGRLLAGWPALFVLLASCSKSAPPLSRHRSEDAVPITVAKVEAVPRDRAIDVWGTLYPKDEATVAAEVEGKVEKTL